MTRAALIGVLVLAGCRDRAEPAPAATSPRPVPRVDAGAVAAVLDAAPVSAGCPDALAGLWTGRLFAADQWQEYRIELTRGARGALSCMQESRWWYGAIDDLAMPRCVDGSVAMGVTTLRCSVTLDDDGPVVASEEQLSRTHSCVPDSGGYLFDRFSGPLTGANTWRATNRYVNTDGSLGEQQVVFRRLRCAP